MKTSRKLMFPPPKEWQNIVQDFELMPTQAETLKVTLEEALDAINQYQAKLQNQPNRSDLVKGLKNFEKALRRLRDECRRSADLIEHFLPDGTLAFIGQSLTFAAISEERRGAFLSFLSVAADRRGVDSIRSIWSSAAQ